MAEAQTAPDAPERFTSHAALRRRLARQGPALRFHGSTAEEARAWQGRARKVLAGLLGLPSFEQCPLDARVTERSNEGDHYRERVEIQVEPGLWMPVFALVPKLGGPRFPVVLAPHGHGGGGKASPSGAGGDRAIEQAIVDYHYDYGRQFCRAGCVALCPDARGFGERQERLTVGNILASSCQYLNQMALPLGQTVTGMWVWDLQCLIAYAATRPDCDTSRLACVGLSGGGLQTLWLAALDERVRVAVVSGYFYGVGEALLDLYANCSCNYVPHAWEHVDHGDLGGLIAPRPLLVQSGDADPLNGASGLDNVRPQLAIARRVYEAFHAGHDLAHDVFHGPHRWDETAPLSFVLDRLNA